MSAGARMVVEHFNRMVEPDGGVIELLVVEAATLKVRYSPGTNEECADCVLDAQDLRELMKEALALQDPSITEVDVDVTPSAEQEPAPQADGGADG